MPELILVEHQDAVVICELFADRYQGTESQAKVEEHPVRWTSELRTPSTTRSPNIGNLRIRLGTV